MINLAKSYGLNLWQSEEDGVILFSGRNYYNESYR